MQPSNPLTEQALRLRSLGLSVIATTSEKRALRPWKKYQSEIISEEELRAQLEDPNAASIAIVAGAVSGNLEFIDIDEKYNASEASLIERWRDLVKSEAPEVLSKLLVQSTPSGGFHIIYRSLLPVSSNKKLARRSATEEETASNGSKVMVLIETRGEGGYALVEPSDGYSLRLGAWDRLSVLSQEERSVLIKCAAALNEYEDDTVVRGETSSSKAIESMGIKPGEDFNQHGDHSSVLRDLGWKFHRNGGELEFWTRPGKDKGVSASWNKRTRHFAVFSSSTEFESVLDNRTTYSLFGILARAKFNNDFQACAKDLYRQGYGKKSERLSRRSVNVDGEVVTEDFPKFWVEDADKRTGEIELKISRFHLMCFLESNGFGKFWAGKSYQLIRVLDNVVSEVTAVSIKDYCRDYINQIPDELVSAVTKELLLAKLYAGASQFFGEAFLDFIKAPELCFLRDTADAGYFFYKNCYVKVTAGGHEVLAYDKMAGVIWEKQRISRSYVDPTDDETPEIETFTHRICSTAPPGEDGADVEVNEEKLASLYSAIGYLLHRFKDRTLTKAIVLCDEKISDKPSGRTGKGMICTVLNYFRNTLRIDARNFNFDKSFMFQSVSFDTDIVEFNDCVREFPFERLFGILTEDMTIEKKNRDEFVLTFAESPKFVLSTNYTILGDGPSFRGRVLEIELSDFYSDSFTPIQDFGHRLFDDWDQDEWSRFDRWAMRCLQLFLRHKLIEYVPKNLYKKKIIQATCLDFVTFADESWKTGEEYDKKVEFEKYCDLFNDKKLGQRTFTKWIREYTTFIKTSLYERRSHGKSLFQFVGAGNDPVVDDVEEKLF